MTYSSGSPGYQPAQSPGSYGASTPSFAKSDKHEAKLPLYLTIAVIALGAAAYLASFGQLFTINTDLGPSGGGVFVERGMGIAAALLAALLAAVSLLPKARNYLPIVAVVAVLGALQVIAQTVSKPAGFSIGWALWFVLACTVLQAIAAVGALLLDAGVVTAPAPRPKYDQYGQYGQYGQYAGQPGGYYGQPGQQHAPYQQHSPQQSSQQSGYGSQYGGYSSGSSTGGFTAAGPQQGSQQGQQQGTTTPPTGFPSFSPPPSFSSSQESQGSGKGNSANHGGIGQGQQSHGQQSHGQQSQGQQSRGQQSQGQGPQSQSPSSPSGPTQS
jgi:uncharacterized membrane protein